MDYNGKTHSIKTEQLPRTWSEILSSFSVREIRKFPLEGQALTNARHAIPRMERRGLTFRTRSKDKHFTFSVPRHPTDQNSPEPRSDDYSIASASKNS